MYRSMQHLTMRTCRAFIRIEALPSAHVVLLDDRDQRAWIADDSARERLELTHQHTHLPSCPSQCTLRVAVLRAGTAAPASTFPLRSRRAAPHATSSPAGRSRLRAQTRACVRVHACVCVGVWHAGEGGAFEQRSGRLCSELAVPEADVGGLRHTLRRTALNERLCALAYSLRIPSGLERSTAVAATRICELAPRRCWAAAKRAARARSKAR